MQCALAVILTPPRYVLGTDTDKGNSETVLEGYAKFITGNSPCDVSVHRDPLPSALFQRRSRSCSQAHTFDAVRTLEHFYGSRSD